MATKVYRQIGERIRGLRKLAHLTQEQLAEKADLSVQFVGFIERGQAKPTLDSLEKIGGALGVRIEDLFRFQKKGEQQTREEIQQVVRLLKNKRPEEIRLFHHLIEQVLEVFLPGKRT